MGKRKWPVAEISIQPSKGTHRGHKGNVKHQHTPPFMPKSMREPFHPGGNSLTYMIQMAHLMGCDPIYCLGFTLQSGTGYFFGLDNPATRKRSFYSDPERAVAWLRWYRSQWPGRARLWPGWSGPIYDVLEVADEAEVQRRLEGRPELAHRERQQPVAIDGRQPVNDTGRREDRHQPATISTSSPGQAKRLPLHRKGVIRG